MKTGKTRPRPFYFVCARAPALLDMTDHFANHRGRKQRKKLRLPSMNSRCYNYMLARQGLGALTTSYAKPMMSDKLVVCEKHQDEGATAVYRGTAGFYHCYIPPKIPLYD